MDKFSQTRRTLRESALVITADRNVELRALTKFQDQYTRAVRGLTAQANANNSKLAGC